MKYSDNTAFTDDSFDFDGEKIKFIGKECVYAKKGIGFKTRGTECSEPMNYYCQWNRKYISHIHSKPINIQWIRTSSLHT